MYLTCRLKFYEVNSRGTLTKRNYVNVSLFNPRCKGAGQTLFAQLHIGSSLKILRNYKKS